MKRLLVVLGLAVGAGLPALAPLSCKNDCSDDEALELFRRRIEPLLDPANPSSCNECHAQGVDLGLYAQGDACGTMACMIDRGIVDLDDPEASLVLAWIDRSMPASELITEETVAMEHEAMLEWIEFNARCNSRVCPKEESPCGGPPSNTDCAVSPDANDHDAGPMPWEDPGDCSEPTLEAMFQAKVYSWRGRCSCHYSDYDGNDGTELDAPEWIEVGSCAEGSVATMHNVLERGLVNFEQPDQSLLLLKPLAESAGGVEHGGDEKFHDTNEGAYLDFRAWIERYVMCNPQ
jgi:hypothetical protein